MRHVVYDGSSAVTWTCWGCAALVWVVAGLGQRSPGGRDLASWLGGGVAALALALPDSLWRSLRVSSPWLELAGVLVLMPATAAAIWSRLVLGAMWSSPARTRDRHELRTSGPYAITRHPIYSAVIAMLVGTTLTQGLGRWVVLLAAITLVLRSKVAAEEQLLTQQFPVEYPRYRERVPKLVPRVRRA